MPNQNAKIGSGDGDIFHTSCNSRYLHYPPPPPPDENTREKVYTWTNECIHSHINTVLREDAIEPQDISTFTVDNAISMIDPKIWNMVVTMTRTVTEKRKNIPPNKISLKRKLHCLYCTCVMFFATNTCCSFPLHVLLTDIVDSQGGSYELIRILNKFGAIASVDTHRRYVQYQVSKIQEVGVCHQLNPGVLSIVTIDNVDIAQRHAMVYNRQNRGFHGTTVQIVQPLSCTNPDTNMDQNTVPIRDLLPLNPTSGPPYKKVARRSRTLTEYESSCSSSNSKQMLPSENQLDINHPLNHMSTNHYSPLRIGHSLKEFKPTEDEEKEVEKLKKIGFFYIVLR